MYWFAVVLLLVIFVYGTARYGSARWLDTGLILIQPSELAKIIMILVLAAYFASQQGCAHAICAGLSAGFILTFGVVVWILLQPNLSTSLVIMVMWFSMMWVSGLPTKYLVIFGWYWLPWAFILFVGLLALGRKDSRLSKITSSSG